MHYGSKLWWTVFLYALLTGLAVQLFFLPHVFPNLHGGAGLLAGHDWNGFHQQAVDQAFAIRESGWHVFRLRPDGENIIIGLCSLLYFFIAPEPWTLLPINAALFACAAWALFSLVKLAGVDDRVAAWAIAPFVFFPSSAVQFSQIHKDVFCTAGLLVIVWCWVGLLGKDLKLRSASGYVLLCVLATGVVWLFRPYFMQILLFWNAVLVLAAVSVGGFTLARQHFSSAGFQATRVRSSAKSAIFLLVLFGVTAQYYSYIFDLRFLPSADLSRQAVGTAAPLSLDIRMISRSTLQSQEAAQMSESSAENLDEFLAEAAKHKRPVAVMKDGAHVENLINKIALKLAVARGGFTNSGKNASTNIDREVVFYGPADVLRYVPRALQIAFFAPFPESWFAAERHKASQLEVNISSVEMLVCYIAFLGWIYWLCNIRSTGVALWLPVLFSLTVLLLMGLTVANVGTLYRMRFPFVMCFVSFGIAGLLQFFKFSPRLGRQK